MDKDLFDVASLADLQKKAPANRPVYLDAFRKKTLLTGLYSLPAGSVDRQKPHHTDEVYYVVEGVGKFTADSEERLVQAGSLLFVKAGVEHRFHDIRKDLRVLVFFAGPRV